MSGRLLAVVLAAVAAGTAALAVLGTAPGRVPAGDRCAREPSARGGRAGGGPVAWRPARPTPSRIGAWAAMAGSVGQPARRPGGTGRRSLLLVGVGSVGLGLVTGPVVALVLVVALAAVPRLVAPIVRRRRLQRRDEQLAPWLERIASGLRAGLSLTGALTATLPATPVPLRDEVAGLEATVQAGGGLAAGLARWAASPDATPPVVLVASALDLGIRAGGEVARAVDRVAATLRDRMEAHAEARALATQARASAAVLAIAPLGFCALLATVEPAVPQILLTTPLGWACLVGGLGLEAAGAAWMARIVAGAR